MEEKIKCLLIKPNELPVEIEIKNTLEVLQEQVQGCIECAYMLNDDSVVLICNEEGKINGMKYNRFIGHDIIVGTFLIVGNDIENGDFKSLTENQVEKYKKVFDKASIKETERVINNILFNNRKSDYER